MREDELAVAILEARAAHDRRNFEHTAATLRDQAWRSEIIFWLAMAIVAFGMLAALLQFRKTWGEPPGATPSEFTLGEKQISVKTTWIGVVLLAMSMAFFALYLTMVYTITAI